MNATLLDISVVVCAYTELRWAALIRAVESLHQQTVAPHEIIVVIDHNRRLFARAQAALPDVVLAENVETRGLSSARNRGIALATGSVIAFMDEDAVAEPDWLARLAAHYAEPPVAGVGGAIMPQWVGEQPSWFPPEFNWVVGCTYRGMPSRTASVRNLIGCNMSFRRSVFAAIGGFRDGIGRIGTRPVGCEETELCIRLHQRWTESVLLYEPLARVTHAVPASRSRWSYFRERCYAEGLSKALIGRFVGSRDSLASERSYTLRTLPLGVLRGVADSLLHGDSGGLLRAGAIIAGLGLTTTGYVAGVAQRPMAKAPAEVYG